MHRCCEPAGHLPGSLGGCDGSAWPRHADFFGVAVTPIDKGWSYIRFQEHLRPSKRVTITVSLSKIGTPPYWLCLCGLTRKRESNRVWEP